MAALTARGRATLSPVKKNGSSEIQITFRAIVRSLAPMILMDEPFAAVDAQTRTQLQADLLNLWSLGRKTIIFVTHDITEAIALGDRALVLSRQPARIAAEHVIPIPRPRNVHDIFALEGFAAVYERIRADVQ